ncbi:MAG: FAD-dependent oxidoreductase [Candidatus Aphodomonas sp.]|nr:FAD-dependent oxidoreductase [Candidatus Aphodomonas sp.]
MKKVLALCLALCMMLFGVTCFAEAAAYTPGTYTAQAFGMNGYVPVTVTVSENKIESIEIGDNYETPGVSGYAIRQVPAAILEYQSLAVDTVTGATFTSRAILNAVEDCLTQAGGDIEALKADLNLPKAEDIEKTADLIIVGGGGAGLTSAIAATQNGANVIVIEKMGTLGGNSILSGGIYNAADQDMQSKVAPTSLDVPYALTQKEARSELHQQLMDTLKEQLDAHEAAGNPYLFDSVEFHTLQTYDGGDYVGDLNQIYQLCSNAYPDMLWIEDLGVEFTDKITQGTGSMWPRTHKAAKPIGTSYIEAYEARLGETDKCEIMTDTTADSLIVDENGAVVGVNAHGKDGNKVILHGSVIMCTGGFAGNVEMRMKYCQGEKWPDLGEWLHTTNAPGVTGEGLLMAQDAGAHLVNMEQIQLLQVCNPYTGNCSDYTEQIGIEGLMFLNDNGQRFVNEGGRRDVVCKAIFDQPNARMWVLYSGDVVTNPDAVFTNGGVPLRVMCENGTSGYRCFETLEEVAEYIGCTDVETLKATLADYNAHCDSQEADEYGRTLFATKFENGPWYVYPRSPAAHHTMGGVDIDLDCHVLNEAGEIINGLYAAGEITGVLHGANRLGGNAIVDFTVYGRIAGTTAANELAK